MGALKRSCLNGVGIVLMDFYRTPRTPNTHNTHNAPDTQSTLRASHGLAPAPPRSRTRSGSASLGNKQGVILIRF